MDQDRVLWGKPPASSRQGELFEEPLRCGGVFPQPCGVACQFCPLAVEGGLVRLALVKRLPRQMLSYRGAVGGGGPRRVP